MAQPINSLEQKRRTSENQGIHTERRREFAVRARKRDRSSLIKKRRQVTELVQEKCQTPSEIEEEVIRAINVVLTTSNDQDRLLALTTLTKHFAHPVYLMSEIALETEGLIEKFTHLLSIPQDDLQLEVLKCLTNISADESSWYHLPTLFTSLPSLITLLSSENYRLVEQACWVVGNIVADSEDGSQAVVNSGGTFALSKILKKGYEMSNNNSKMCVVSPSDSLIRTSVWVLSNIALSIHSDVNIDEQYIKLEIPQLLILYLSHEDESVCVESGWVLAFLSSRSSECANLMMMNAQALTNVVQCLLRSQGSNPLAAPMIRILGNLVSISEAYTNEIVSIPYFMESLNPIFLKQHQSSSVPIGLMKETLWLVANISAGSVQQRQLIINSAIILPTINCLLTSSTNFDHQKESLLILGNLIGVKPNISFDMINYVITMHLIEPIMSALRTSDEEVLFCALSIINALVGSEEARDTIILHIEPVEQLLFLPQTSDAIRKLAVSAVDLFCVDEASDEKALT